MSCRIGVLGPEGTYSEKAALLWSKGTADAKLVYFSDFEDALLAVESGELDVAIEAVETGLQGSRAG